VSTEGTGEEGQMSVGITRQETLRGSPVAPRLLFQRFVGEFGNFQSLYMLSCSMKGWIETVQLNRRMGFSFPLRS